MEPNVALAKGVGRRVRTRGCANIGKNQIKKGGQEGLGQHRQNQGISMRGQKKKRMGGRSKLRGKLLEEERKELLDRSSWEMTKKKKGKKGAESEKMGYPKREEKNLIAPTQWGAPGYLQQILTKCLKLPMLERQGAIEGENIRGKLLRRVKKTKNCGTGKRWGEVLTGFKSHETR